MQTTLLEARLLTGKRELYARFTKRMHDVLDPAAFLQAKTLEQQQRHARFAGTSLEPNVKESAGGLRDLQTVLWIARAARDRLELARAGAPRRHHGRRGARVPAARAVPEGAARYACTTSPGRREDRLLFDHQSALAREFGVYDRPHRLASEQLMQRYYRTAKAVSQLNTIVLQNLGARVMPARTTRSTTRSTSASACATSCWKRATSDCSSASPAPCSRASCCCSSTTS